MVIQGSDYPGERIASLLAPGATITTLLSQVSHSLTHVGHNLIGQKLMCIASDWLEIVRCFILA